MCVVAALVLWPLNVRRGCGSTYTRRERKEKRKKEGEEVLSKGVGRLDG